MKRKIHEVRLHGCAPARYIYVALIDGEMTDLARWGNRLPTQDQLRDYRSGMVAR